MITKAGKLRRIRIHILLASVIVFVGSVCHADDSKGSESCRDGQAPQLASGAGIAPGVEGQAGKAVSQPHSVKLSWQASVPASKQPADAIRGYNIYRREAGKKYERINQVVIPQTACTDYTAEGGHTYVYQVQAVTESGTVSKFSKDASASLR